VSVDPPITHRASHLGGCLGFWLWALVGMGATLGFISFAWFALLPAALVGYLVSRRGEWKDGPVLLGLLAGAGCCLLLVAAINWNGWHHRTPGNEYPNPYHWGGVGLCLVVASVLAYAVGKNRSS
jgi:hypothetical protein